MGRPAGSQNKDKPYREALRMEALAAADGEECQAKEGSLRWIARQQLIKAGEDTAAAKEIADRLDGKPAQESMVTIDDKRDAADWTRAELVAFLDDAKDGGERTAPSQGRQRKPDSVH